MIKLVLMKIIFLITKKKKTENNIYLKNNKIYEPLNGHFTSTIYDHFNEYCN